MAGPERAVEKHLRTQVERRGGWALKFYPLRAGNPDRIVILPGHPIYLVETKAPGGHVRPIQQVWHDRARARGHEVYVLWDRASVDRWLARIDEGPLD